VKSRRIGILGGTFDPVHCGHVRLCRAARKGLKLDRIICVPSRRNPLKGKSRVSGWHRRAMLDLAVRGLPYASVCRFELSKNRPSYTVETVRYLRRRFGFKAELFFVCGSDVLEDMGRWRHPRALRELCRFAVARRPGSCGTRAVPGVKVFGMRPLRVSSTRLRKAPPGDAAWKDVPKAVVRYIRRHGLYTFQSKKGAR